MPIPRRPGSFNAIEGPDRLEQYLDVFLEVGLDPKTIQNVDMVNEVGRGIGAPKLSRDEAEEIFELVHLETGPDGTGGIVSTDIDYAALYNVPTYEGENQMSNEARDMINKVAEGADPSEVLRQMAYGVTEAGNMSGGHAPTGMGGATGDHPMSQGGPGGTGGTAPVADPGSKPTDYTAGDTGQGKPTTGAHTTSPDPTDGHTHTVTLDQMGNGTTSAYSMGGMAHSHPVAGWQVSAYKAGNYVSQHFGLLNSPQA